MEELYKKYRPRLLKHLIGQDKAVQMIKSMLKEGMPHTLLLTGQSGIGKTTAARIIAEKMGCRDRDLVELNAASSRGIDDIRLIESQVNMAPMKGNCRIWIVDESHALTSQAQTSFLKILEDTPNHVYFILATTHPTKLISTIHTRSTEIKFKSIPESLLINLLESVVSKESKQVPMSVLERIAECAEGSARKSLVLLEQIIDIENEEDQLDCVQKSDSRIQAFDLCRALMAFKPAWGDISKILKEIEDEPETIRRMVLGYANSVLIGGGKQAGRAFLIIDYFRDDYFSCGKAGLTASCWGLVCHK